MDPLPEFAPLLEAARTAPALDLTGPVVPLRAAADAGVVGMAGMVRDAGPLHEVADLEVDGVPVRVYRPTPAAAGVHVHLHGGGWWMGSLETVDPMARELAVASGLVVVSVGYRLAPETPFPGALEDVYRVLLWVSETLAPRSLSVGGESAGANLAAAVTLMARERGGPRLDAQWLDVPAVDLSLPETPSVAAYGTGFGLDVEPVRTIRDWYVGTADVRHPWVSPMFADLEGLPPAVVTVNGLDPLRDQGEAYAAALRTAGVEVDLSVWDGHLHGTTWLTGATASAGDWHAHAVSALVGLHQVSRTVAA